MNGLTKSFGFPPIPNLRDQVEIGGVCHARNTGFQTWTAQNLLAELAFCDFLWFYYFYELITANTRVALMSTIIWSKVYVT
jgi:hypothetical protein